MYHAPAASNILRPGLLTLPQGVERYLVEGVGSLIVEVEAGDQIRIIDKEGCQPGEIIGIGKDGCFNDAVLDNKADCSAEGFKAILAGGDVSAQRALAALKRRSIDIADARCVDCLVGQVGTRFVAHTPRILFFRFDQAVVVVEAELVHQSLQELHAADTVAETRPP